MKIILFFLFLVISLNLVAQTTGRFYFETSFVSKISLGPTTRETVQYEPGLTVNFPNRSTYVNLVYSIEVGAGYKLFDNIAVGLSSGISAVKFDQHPLQADEYYDRVLFPLVLNGRYQKSLEKGWLYQLDIGAGHQFADFKFGGTPEGFLIQEFGGFIGYFNIGVGKVFGKYTPTLKLGYELNQFSHEDSLGWINQLEYEDKIFYKTHYHLIRVAIAMKI